LLLSADECGERFVDFASVQVSGDINLLDYNVIKRRCWAVYLCPIALDEKQSAAWLPFLESFSRKSSIDCCRPSRAARLSLRFLAARSGEVIDENYTVGCKQEYQSQRGQDKQRREKLEEERKCTASQPGR
jgi:hypothetical protein